MPCSKNNGSKYYNSHLWTMIRTGDESRVTLAAKKELHSAQTFKLCEEVCLN